MPPDRTAATEISPYLDPSIAVEVCARSDEHSAGLGRHDAHRWGPCSDHERIVQETLEVLREAIDDPSLQPNGLHSVPLTLEARVARAQRLAAARPSRHGE